MSSTTPTPIPDTQRTWVVVRQGKPRKALELKEEWPVPKKLAPGQVLVRVQAAALNPVGWKIMRSLPTFLSKRPHPAEHDFSGVVVDANGSKFAVGDSVYGWVPTDLQFKTKEGVLTHFLRVHEDYIVKKPENITPTQAAGITLTAVTAYQALVHAKLEAEQTILINGGSTAVGAMAIQIAKAKGAKVYATASAKNEDYVRKLGADEFIDYTKGSLVEHLIKNPPSPKFHVIYDAAGLVDPSLFTSSAKYLAPGGIFISTGPLPHGWGDTWKVIRTFGAILVPSWLGNVNRKYAILFADNKSADLEEIRKLVADGSVKPVVDSVYEFDDALKAYDRILTLHATGKVVVKVDPTAA